MKKVTIGRLLLYPVILIMMSLFFKDQIASGFFKNNGFDLTDALINSSDIHHGGPAKDGIPAIDNPVFVTAKQADFLSDDSRVLALEINGIAKAYPINILNYHEIVNDTFVDRLQTTQAVVITYCPLCGSGVAYSARLNGNNTSFGVSGLLYNSDVLLYDRESNSLWSQLLSKAISGPMNGYELEMLPLNHTTWKAWKNEHNDTLVLSEKTGYQRNYSQTPYDGYDRSKSLYFPVIPLNSDYHPKEYVLGLKISGKTKAYPFAELSKVKSPYKDTFSGQELTIIFDAKNRTGKILDKNNNEIPSVMSFWFAWIAFYPDSIIFKKTE